MNPGNLTSQLTWLLFISAAAAAAATTPIFLKYKSDHKTPLFKTSGYISITSQKKKKKKTTSVVPLQNRVQTTQCSIKASNELATMTKSNQGLSKMGT